MISILVTRIALPFFTVRITDPEKVDPSIKTALIKTARGLKLDSLQEISLDEKRQFMFGLTRMGPLTRTNTPWLDAFPPRDPHHGAAADQER